MSITRATIRAWANRLTRFRGAPRGWAYGRSAPAGTWSPAATSYGYQWYANGKAISGDTKSSLVLKAAQKGEKITVKVIAHRTGHKDGSALSKATKAVAG
jgi:hypothetical protein